MPTPFYRLIPGSFVLIGKEPDGDSVRFRPDNPADLKKLSRAPLIQPSKDGSVQLRYDGIDATELHYGKAAQPFGVEARDALLKHMGFTKVTTKPNSTIVEDSTPKEVPGAILSKAAEANGRPVSFVLIGQDAKVPASKVHHGWVHVDADLLKKTANYFMLESGNAYPTFYTSLAEEIQATLRELASAARTANKVVWAKDMTSLFKLESQKDIDEKSGNPILPKLFRRSTDFLRDVASGAFSGNLTDWIKAHEAGSRSENDLVEVAGLSGRVPLSSLLEQRNDRVAFLPDLLDVVFVEK
jgi:hypothetical protein